MADQQQGIELSATFPDPPPFWRDFTPEKIEQYEDLKARYADQNGLDVSSVFRVPNVPADLINLQPPPEPTTRKWRLFDEQIPLSLDIQLKSLEDSNIENLVSHDGDIDGKHVDRAFELKRLAKSLLLNFLELMGVMGMNPEQGAEKVKDIQTLLLNFHHILNEYRPHQAREQLIALMQDQLDAKRAETAAIRAVTDKAKRVMEGLGSIEVPSAKDGPTVPSVGNKAVDSAQHASQTRLSDDLQRELEREAWLSIESEIS